MFRQCSVSCGSGIRRRAVKCVVKETNNVVNDEECAHIQKPEPTSNCSKKPCTRWNVGDWGPVRLNVSFKYIHTDIHAHTYINKDIPHRCILI